MASQQESKWVLAQTIAEVRFSKPLNDFTFRNKIQRIITGNNSDLIDTDESVNFRDTNKKMAVMVQPMRVGVLIEGDNPTKAINNISTLINSLNDSLHFSHISRMGLRQVHYRECFADDYSAFVAKFKEIFLSSSSQLVSKSTDVGLPLNISDYTYPVGLSVGPMSGSELKDNTPLNFAGEDLELPEYYLTANIDSYSLELTSLSHKFLKNFIAESLESIKKLHKSIDKDWKSHE